MEFIHQYAKEIFSIVVPFITWILNNQFKAKAKLQLAVPHSFTFMVQEPLRNAAGEIVRPTQGVYTASRVLKNSGKETATNVELVFNWKPLCINIWPSRHYTEHLEPDNRYVIVFDSLAPNEQIGVEVLSVNNELPALVNARSDQCAATVVEMYPQVAVSAWKRKIASLLMFLGLAFAIYILIVSLQFLILSAPQGH